MNRRVVITGLGVLAPGGGDTGAFWDMIVAGRSATRLISTFDPSPYRSRVAGECDFDPAAHGFTPREIRRMDRASQFGVVCARAAVGDSGIDLASLPPERLAVVVGTATGSATSLEREYLVLSDSGRQWVVDADYQSAGLFDYFVPSAISAEVARSVGAEGPVTILSSGCTSGLDAIGHAYQLVQEGSAEVVLAGGTEAPITPITVACFDAIKATTPRNDDPAGACRPFDRTRNGFALAEGAAMLVLEERGHAERRGATVYAEITGYATRCNAYHMTGLRPDGREMTEAINDALKQSDLGAAPVDYVNAHGSGTRQNDIHETAAVKRSLGADVYRTPMSSIKSMVGHSLGAIGSIEIAACALAIRHDVVPPTANLREPDPECDLDYVPLVAREHRVSTALTVGSGFGGFQSALVLRDPTVVAR
ncbi:beta-ketoacyl-[acyl-carrier-protein] synthase family protein [Micromonospora cathayae]|uniref:Beta-ketoacyl-[acyl-carrier-protein] synthase family protein n=1 Tax=Micromonospora cathayae TaxID=3028804 RepID=A0ABY7ZNV2_9ACTN|nr:beta-ketoacyl-[acyl-carrier-protein] synthase family protein [Micromonospora sp. HUAS 3]WDZ83574.1 beta-ketoacyl-[acyl-carrier-protein] synthase family protein [Micromonospora sp. HUAS 3]